MLQREKEREQEVGAEWVTQMVSKRGGKQRGARSMASGSSSVGKSEQKGAFLAGFDATEG